MPELRWIFHVPNGGWRNIRTAAKLKLQGVRPGVPDYVWPLPRGQYRGMWLELKRVRGGVVEKTQKEWHDWLRSQGYHVVVAKGAAEGWEALTSYYQLPSPVPLLFS